MDKESSAAKERLQAYVDAKTEVGGLHPEVIHVIHTSSGKHELKVSDLKAAIVAMGEVGSKCPVAGETTPIKEANLASLKPACSEISSRSFVKSITSAIGPYTDLNGHKIVADAYAILRSTEPMVIEKFAVVPLGPQRQKFDNGLWSMWTQSAQRNGDMLIVDLVQEFHEGPTYENPKHYRFALSCVDTPTREPVSDEEEFLHED